MARLSYSVRRCEAVFGHIEDEHSDDKVGSRGPRQLLLLQPGTTDVKTSVEKCPGLTSVWLRSTSSGSPPQLLAGEGWKYSVRAKF